MSHSDLQKEKKQETILRQAKEDSNFSVYGEIKRPLFSFTVQLLKLIYAV